MALHFRPKLKSLTNPSLIHLFSTTPTYLNHQSPQNPTSQSQSQSQPQSSLSSLSSSFNGVKGNLQQQQEQLQKPTYSSISLSKPTDKVASIEEIPKNFLEVSRRSAVSPHTESDAASSSRHISLQELYKRNVIGKSNGSSVGVESGPGNGGKPSFEPIRESLRQMRSSAGMSAERKGGEAMSLSVFKESLRLKPSHTVLEMRDRKEGGEENE